MRVISGSAKGRTLKSPGSATRPITDRVKVNLFNILGARVIDANVLDLFAGAGSVGIEALSRGARHATFVELDREALRTIRENLERARLSDRASVVREDVFRFIRRGSDKSQSIHSPTRQGDTREYDLIYAAPPQYKELWSETMKTLDGRNLLADRGVIVVQMHPKEFRDLAFDDYALADQRKYGSTMLCFYHKRPH
jgi:16S rRNA (guanine966-N2)-methyltransferase